jgi:hypothetical protein
VDLILEYPSIYVVFIDYRRVARATGGFTVLFGGDLSRSQSSAQVEFGEHGVHLGDVAIG